MKQEEERGSSSGSGGSSVSGSSNGGGSPLSVVKLTPIVPFEPVRVEQIPIGDDWVAQVKWDGVRMLTYYDGRNIRLMNRRGNERTLQYPEFGDVKSYCRADSVILDGEMIAIAGGKPSFHEIMRRDSVRREQEIRFAVDQVAAIYMIFDVLYVNGRWVHDRPLSERQQLLKGMIEPSERVQLVPNVADARSLYTVMEQQHWEGIVCKRLDSPYLFGGKDARWVKIKLYRDLVAVVGGVTYRDGIVNALLLGLYDEEGRLHYIGHAGPGKSTHDDMRKLTEMSEQLRSTACSFVAVPREKVKGAQWWMPVLTVKVRFAEWTPGGTMRQPVVEGLSPSVPPVACRF